MLVAAVIAGWFVHSAGGRRNLDLRDVAPGVYLAPDAASVHVSTAQVCPHLAGCVQAVESSRIRIIRFDTRTAAWSQALRLAPDAWRSDWFVIQYLQPQTMTHDDYQYVITGLDAVDTWQPGR